MFADQDFIEVQVLLVNQTLADFSLMDWLEVIQQVDFLDLLVLLMLNTDGNALQD
tara:strand:- start:464 stop:628 length:165 start_codon:yes stop_codon:yes gene_type:complete